MNFFSIALSLFVVLNAIGNIPLFIGLLARYEVKQQRKIIIRELLIALFILLLFSFFGESILGLLHISQPVIGMAGGALLFIISLKMIFPKTHQNEISQNEPLIVPLATPITAGPGAIAMVMVYSEQIQSSLFMTAIILLAWLPSFLILFLSSNIKYFLGEKGLSACEKLGGMLICLIAVQMFSSGAIKLIETSLFSHQ